MNIKKVLLGTASALMIGAVCAFGAYPAADVSAADETMIEINETNFPDSDFRKYISNNFDKSPKDGQLSESEISSVKTINVSSATLTRGNIINLKGIEYFTSLTRLDCGLNKLTTLDVSKNTALTYLDCKLNYLTTLDVSKNTALTYLDCGGNSFTTLDVSKNTALTELICGSNELTALDVSKNTALTYLYCSFNDLTTLDVSKNTALTSLSCNSNQLTTLDVSKNTALTSLNCNINQLTALDVSNNPALSYLDCKNNKITSLDLSKNPGLTKLYCSDNQLASLKLSEISPLERLECNNNKLEKLSVKNLKYLSSLLCKDNNLKIIDASNTPLLKTTSISQDSDAILVRDEYAVYDDETGVVIEGFDGAKIGTGLEFEVQNVNTSGIRIPGERIAASYDLILKKSGFSVNPENFIKVTIFVPDGADWTKAKVYGIGNGTPINMNAVYDLKFNYLSFQTIAVGGYFVTIEGESTVTEITDEQTKIKIEGINGTLFDWDAVLDVQKKDTSGISITGEDVAAAYDIKLKRGGEEIKPEGKIKVTIPVPGEITDGASAKIFRQEANGTYTQINTAYNSGNKTLSFETDSLGVYAVTTETPYPDGDINKDGDFDIDDVIDLARSILTTTDPAKNPYLPEGDRDKSGKIDIDDVILLARELIM